LRTYDSLMCLEEGSRSAFSHAGMLIFMLKLCRIILSKRPQTSAVKPLHNTCVCRSTYVSPCYIFTFYCPTSREVNSVLNTATDQLMLFREVIGFDCENRAKQISALYRQSVEFRNVTACGNNRLSYGDGMHGPIELHRMPRIGEWPHGTTWRQQFCGKCVLTLKVRKWLPFILRFI
jgi:hypothetical protein